jgi:molecular chaperone DnaK (HSP70)
MGKKNKAGKQSRYGNKESVQYTSNTTTLSPNTNGALTETISVAINIGSHSCTVSYYNPSDQKSVIISNPDGLYATPTTITPVETDHGLIETVGRAWYTSPDQKTMFFESLEKKNVPLMEKMLKFMIHIAEDFTGKVVDNILLVTPVYFTSEQNTVLENIITKNLNLTLSQIIPEPVAACLAYELDRTKISAHQRDSTINTEEDSDINSRELILVLDFGFKTSKASLIIRQVKTGLLTTLYSEMTDIISGYNIDQYILEYILSEIKRKYFNNRFNQEQERIISDPNSRLIRVLKQCIEDAKITLSRPNVNKTNLSAESLLDGVDVNIELLRARFEMSAERILNQIPFFIDKCLDNAKRQKLIPPTLSANTAIDRLVLIGGTSKILRLKQIVLKHLRVVEEDKERCLSNIEYAATVGGAFQLHLIQEDNRQEEDVILKKGKNSSKENKKKQLKIQKEKKSFDDLKVPCIPLSISLNTHGDGLSCLFPRFSTVPCEEEVVVSNAFDKQQYMLLRIVEGERPLASQNREIGLYILEMVDKAEKDRGELECKLLFSINEDGELSVEIDEPDDDTENKQLNPKFVLHNVRAERNDGIQEEQECDSEDIEDNFEDEDVLFDKKKLEITKKRVNEVLKQASDSYDSDMEILENREARMKLESYCYKCRKTLREQFANDRDKMQHINNYVNETVRWVNENPNSSKRQYLIKLHEFHEWYTQQINK